MHGTTMRMNRLFNGKNAVIVAIDHGEFDGPIEGMVNLPKVAEKIYSGVSGILMAPGMLRHCSKAVDYKGSPMAVVRVNWSSVYAFAWNYNDANTVQAYNIADAVAQGADVALISLTMKTGSEQRDAANVELFCKLANEAHHLGIPVIGEVFPTHCGQISKEDMHQQIKNGCRIIAELGADLVKTFHTYKFQEVAEGCPVPILCLGAEKMPTQQMALELAEKIVNDGARGVVFGRNAIQVPDPMSFQKALCDVVQEGITAVEAVSKYNIKD